MRSRWFHQANLHSPLHGHGKTAGWLELFYDLIFVAAFIQLGNGLSKEVSLGGFAIFSAAFAALWIVWSGFTYYMNRFTVDDFVHRLMVFAQMFMVGMMAFSASDLVSGDYRRFALAYATGQAIVALFNLRSWLQVPEGRQWSAYWGSIFAVAAASWAVAAFLPPPWAYVMMTAGVLVIVSGPLSRVHRSSVEQYPIDEHHLAERFGLLTLIVLGESFVKVLDAAVESDSGMSLLAQASVLLVLTFSIWWTYFDDIAGSKIRSQPLAQTIWWLGHLPLQLAITSTGVGIKKAATLDLSVTAGSSYRWLLCGSLSLVLFAVAAIDSVTERRQAELSDRARIGMRFGSAVLMLLLAPAGAGMSGRLFLVLVTALLVAQVVFDMMMAPFEDTPMHQMGAVSLAERARLRRAGEAPDSSRRRDVSEAVRRGTPSALRQDLYFYFMQGGWFRVFGAFAFVYLMFNVFFAALYRLRPDSIAPLEDTSFAEAFFFSVQTFSTIGYGVLNPATDYGNLIVTIEAATGLLTVAVFTGLIFAKVSHPEAKVLFSHNVLITKRHGVRTLLFRVGNVRGNEIAEASMYLTALVDEITPEGDHTRLLVELPLVRNRSPMFVLTWTVMHRLDENSPLADVDWHDEARRPISLLATLVGHDTTYGQTVHARKVWHPEDVLCDHTFVDVLSDLPDGRILVDYEHFHDTRPQETEAETG